MYALVYHSVAAPDLKREDIEKILEQSRSNNRRDNITGCLLFHNGEFLQILEGEESKVSKLYEKIMDDPRNTHNTVIYDHEICERLYSNWDMAFLDFGDIDISHLNIEEFVSWHNSLEKPAITHKLFHNIATSII